MKDFEIVHQIPGRIRIKVPSIRWLPKDAQALGKKAKSIGWVEGCTVNFCSASLIITFKGEPDVNELKDVICDFLKIDKRHAVGNPKGNNTFTYQKEEHVPLPILIVTGIILIASWFYRLLWGKGVTKPFGPSRFLNLPALATIVLGYPILKQGLREFLETEKLNMELLVCIASTVSLIFGEALTAFVVMWLMNLSAYLENKVAEKTRIAIRNILKVDKKKVWKIMDDGAEIEIDVEDLQVGEKIILKTGDSIPIDGETIEGYALVDESPMTGESIPVYKSVGDKVLAGTRVSQGKIMVRVEHVGEDTRMGSIIKMIEKAPEKAPIQLSAERFSEIVPPISLALALLTFLFTRNIAKTMSMLIIVCPCAVTLSTPAALTAAMGNAVSNGILIKGGAYLEASGDIDALALDKTGTLTQGTPRVSRVISTDPEISPHEVFKLAASAQLHSTHPFSQALIQKIRECEIEVPPYEKTELIIGGGMKAIVDGSEVLIGSHRFMEEFKIEHEAGHEPEEFMKQRGENVLFVAKNGALIGLIGIKDELRKGTERVLRRLRELGIKKIVMLTGDNEKNTKTITRGLDFDEIHWEMSPEDKANYIKAFKKKNPDLKIAMVGDGINDTAAFSYADLSFSMGSRASHAAIEHADIVLNKEDIALVLQVVDLGQKTVETIKENYRFSIILNLLGVLLASIGLISPLTGALLHNSITVYVVGNSSKLLFYKTKINEKQGG